MGSEMAKGREPIPHQAFLDEIHALQAENRALKDEVQSLKINLEEADELRRAISEGDLDALIIPGPEGELVFTLDSADRAYRVLVETMNEGTATLGFDGTILYCNRRLAELLKINLHDITGTSIFRFIAPEDAATFKALLEHKMGSGEIKLRAAGGKSLPVYLSISSLQAENSPNAWCLVITDLTEQKKNEEIVASERLARSIIEQSADLIAVCDTSGRITRFSNSMLRLFGFVPTFRRFEDLINLQFSEGPDAGKSILPVSSALKGLTILGAEVTFESRDCQRRLHLLLNSEPLNDSEGEIIGCVMALTDITERKRAEKKLQLAYEELQVQSEDLEAQAEELRKANEALSKSEKRFELLSEANALLLSSNDPEALIQTIAEKVMLHLNCDVFFNYVFDKVRGKLHLNAYAGISAEAAKEIEWLDKEDGTAICSCVALDRCRMISKDAQHNRDQRADLVRSMWIKAYACQPLHIGEKTIGTLSFGTKSRKGFTEDELSLMSTVADQVSIAIKRKQEENRILRYNKVLDGINRIFGSVVKAETEEELGNLCLSVALEVTGGGIGFVGEVGVDGLLHDIAISDMGWNQCLMYDKTGHRRPPGDFILHGLYGYVIDSGKSFYANDPQSHSNSIGMPKNHPLLTSFLGVPLISNGKIMGMIAVANLEGGYSSEQQEDLEAIAPAVMQALKRKRAEQERDQTEKALQESEAKSRHLIKYAPTGIYEIDFNGPNFKSVNDVACQMSGYTREELLALNPFELFDEESRERFRERIRKSLAGEKVNESVEYVVFGKDGRKIYTLLNMHIAYKDRNVGAVVVAHDITERKKAEQQLYNINQRLLALMNALPVGVSFSDDPTCQTISGNPALMAQFEIRPEDNISASAPDDSAIGRQIHYFQDGRQLSDIELPLQRAVAENREVPPIELEIEMPNGRHWFAEASGAPIRDMNGNVIGGVAVTVDITTRKKIEEALKKANDTLEEKVIERTAELEEAFNSLLENELRLSEAQKIAHLGNWDWNLLTDELYWSDEIYRIFGLDPLELVPTYNESLSRIDPEDRSYVHNAIQKALSGELYSIEYGIILPDGGKRIVHSQGEVTFDEKHIPSRMRGIIQDITERKKAEEALEKMEKIRIKEIHHRIKNNLQVISSLLDLQAEKFEEEKAIEAFREGQNRVFSMALIHEELYKGEGTDKLDFSVYLKKLAENLFGTYSLQSGNVRLSMDLEEDAFLDMDTAVPLGIIVNELISNSLKHAFTEKEEGEIRIRLCRDEEMSNGTHKSLFSLIISDNGKGIPEDVELESAESLGLQLVSILVDQLDGEIELNREQGTEFKITFDAVESDTVEK